MGSDTGTEVESPNAEKIARRPGGLWGGAECKVCLRPAAVCGQKRHLADRYPGPRLSAANVFFVLADERGLPMQIVDRKTIPWCIGTLAVYAAATVGWRAAALTRANPRSRTARRVLRPSY